jgi:hypothetical protein
MPKAFPEEFRRDVVAVPARAMPSHQIAKDFGVSLAALHRWMKIADKEDGVASGPCPVTPRSCGKRTNASGSSSRKRKSCAAPWPTCPGTSSQKNDLPAGPRAGCRGMPGPGSRGSVLTGVDISGLPSLFRTGTGRKRT